MRFHSDLLTTTDVYAAASAARVSFYKLDEKRSRSRNRAWDLRLEGHVSNRLLNFGDGYSTAATWDEWGIFLNVLFERDPLAHCDYYRGQEDFRIATGCRFDDLEPKDQHPNHKFDWTGEPGLACKCGATMLHQRPKVVVVKGSLMRLDRIHEVESWLSA